VVISPFIKPGTVSNTDYNHYSLLLTLEDIFGDTGSSGTNTLTGGIDPSGSGASADTDGPYLGFAAQPGLAPFGSDIFTNEPVQTKTVTQTSTVTTTTPGKTKVYAVVPYVAGDSISKAEKAIRASGLKVGKVTTEKSKKHKGSLVVASTSPSAGQRVKQGTKVTLKVKRT
jgi:hypothetical protein